MNNRERFIFIAILVVMTSCLAVILIFSANLNAKFNTVQTELSELKDYTLNLSTLTEEDVSRSITDTLGAIDSEEIVKEFEEIISRTVVADSKEVENDTDIIWEKAREYVPSNLEVANYYYMNALSKSPEKHEIWEDYISNALEYCDADGLSLVYSNLDVAIMSVDSEYIDEMIELRTEVLDRILSLELEAGDKGQAVSADASEFLSSCNSFMSLFDNAENTVDIIDSLYSELTDAYYNIESADADSAYADASTIMNLFESLIDLQSYGEYAKIEYDSFVDLASSMSLLNTSKTSLQYTYGSVGKTYSLIDSEMEKLAVIEAEIKAMTLSALKQMITSKRPSLAHNNSDTVEALNEYQLLMEELLQLVGSQVDFYEIINEEVVWISTALNNILIDRQKKYQRWAYSVMVKVKDLNPKKCSRSVYDDFISIDTSLLIAELKVIYTDIYDNIKKNLKSFDALIQYNSSVGLRKLEDF